MNIYCFDLAYDMSTEEALPYLSAQRAEYCKKIKNPLALRQSVFSYLLLRYGLKTGYGIDDPPEFVFGERGKPGLTGTSGIYFSMSHCKTAAICALSDAPVGADIQDVRNIKQDVAKKFCTENELTALEAMSDEERVWHICRLWCIKESYGKMTGNGFSEGFSGIEAMKLVGEKTAFVTKRNGNFLSACRKGGIGGVNILDIGGEALKLWK